MRTVIDVTPVSSRTTGPAQEQHRRQEPRSRWQVAWRRLKIRFMVFAFVATVVAAVVLVASIGFIIFVALLGTAAVLAATRLAQRALGGRSAAGRPPAGSGIARR